ncbi:hypothetical protein [Brachybacterium vulturis]|uniref:hypothetical protein n=1 Tax=Brachybacterium vulturis TaxID=2017484 RepID=UPI003736861A
MSAPLPQLPPAQKHRAIAGRFSEVVRGVTGWEVRTPVRRAGPGPSHARCRFAPP